MLSGHKKHYLFHLRPVPVMFAAVMMGILLFTSGNIIVMTLFPIVIGIVAIGGAFYCKSKLSIKILAGLFCFTCILGILSSVITQQSYLAQKIEGESLQVEGVISMDSDDKQIYLDFVSIDGERKTGRVMVENVGWLNYGVGDRISFVGSVEFLKYDFYDSYSMLNYQKNIMFYAKMKNLISLEAGSVSFKETIKIGIYRILYRYMDTEEASLTMAMMFGDKKNMNPQMIDAYRSTGMAHIFAVSGLHASVIGGIILFLLKKFKANRYVKFAILSGVMLFYSYLCSFTPSVLRASLMLIFYAFADLTGRYQSRISAVSMAALLILLVRPFSLFSISFQMSFAAYFGILFFQRPISAFLAKILPKALSETIGLSISVNIMVFPFSAFYFGSFSVIFLLGNIVFMPFLTFAFTMIIVSLLAIAIVPFAGYALTGVGYVIKGVNAVNAAVADFSHATMSMQAQVPFIVLYCITCILLCRYHISEKKIKYPLAMVTGLSAAGLFIAGFVI